MHKARFEDPRCRWFDSAPGHQYLKGLQKRRLFSLSKIQCKFLQSLVTSHFFESFQFFLKTFLQNY